MLSRVKIQLKSHSVSQLADPDSDNKTAEILEAQMHRIKPKQEAKLSLG